MIALEVRNLSKHFGQTEIIDNLSLKIQHGEKHALIGPNGAGKSTLLNLITGIHLPSAGKIFLNDQKISSLQIHSRARLGLARTLQSSSNFESLSVFENILAAAQYGHSLWQFRQNAIDKVEHILDQVHLSHRRLVEASDLSHGEQRLLEIGIALATNPKVMLMDEPMAGLTEIDRRVIAEILDGLEEITLLFVEHDMDSVFSIAEKISVLHKGQLIAQGNPDQIENNEQVQNVYLGREANA